MAAVSTNLLETIKELQGLQSLEKTYLGGGTSLAIRYNHRESVDIDLFFSDIIGKDGFKTIEEEVNKYFGNRISNLHYPCEENDQYIFLRFWVKAKKVTIKVEIMQNINFHDPAEEISGVRLAAVRDVGLMKMVTVSNRASNKDVYDLDYLTEEVSLQVLLKELKEKQERFNSEEHRTIFDMDGKEASPVDDPLILLKYDTNVIIRNDRPNHSSNRIQVEKGSKNLMEAKNSYRRKVRRLCNDLGIDFPSVTPIN